MRRTIKVKSGIITGEDGYKEYIYSKVELELLYVKVYIGVTSRTGHLSTATRIFLDYLTIAMDEHNQIDTNAVTTVRFNQYLKRISDIQYSHSAVKKGFSQLRKAEIVIDTPIRGIAWVNPEFYFKSNEEDRKELLEKIYEYKAELKFEEAERRRASGETGFIKII